MTEEKIRFQGRWKITGYYPSYRFDKIGSPHWQVLIFKGREIDTLEVLNGSIPLDTVAEIDVIVQKLMKTDLE